MTVYVDDARNPYRRMVMCHVLADTTEELVAAVEAVGVSRRWIQAKNTSREHFDVCLSKRALLVKNGAVELTRRELGELLRKRSSGPRS